MRKLPNAIAHKGGENMTDTQNTNVTVPANNAAQSVDAQVQPQVQPVAAPVATVNTENERTANQFEKLLESNRELYESNQLLRQELQQRREANQQFAPVQAPPVPQQPAIQGVNPEDFIETDPVSGERYINDAKLQARIAEVNNRVSRAEEVVQKYIDTAEQREIERQNQEAFSAHPELNPADPKFDVVFHNLTKGIIYDSVLNSQDYGGKPLSFRDAADYVRKNQTRLSGSTTEAAQAATDVQEQLQAATELKQQASAQPTGEQPIVRQNVADEEELRRLRMQTRLGSPDALAARIAHTEHIKVEIPG